MRTPYGLGVALTPSDGAGLLKRLPSDLVVFFAVASIEWGDVFDRALHWAAELRVVFDRAVELCALRRVFQLVVPRLAIDAYAHQAAVVRKRDAAVGIVPRIGFVALQHGELDPIYRLELL